MCRIIFFIPADRPAPAGQPSAFWTVSESSLLGAVSGARLLICSHVGLSYEYELW